MSVELTKGDKTIVIKMDSEGVLDLSKNKINSITNIKGLKELKNLKKLLLNKNKITEIKGLEDFPELWYLDLSHNKITEIKGLENLSHLQVLHLGWNKITQIKGLDKLINLSWLNLWNNKYDIYYEGLEYLINLESLTLDFKSKSLKGLGTLVNLKTLRLYTVLDRIKRWVNNNVGKLPAGGKLKNPMTAVGYCQRTDPGFKIFVEKIKKEAEAEKVAKKQKEQEEETQKKLPEAAEFIIKASSIYEQISFQELIAKTGINYHVLSALVEDMIFKGEIKAKIADNKVNFLSSESKSSQAGSDTKQDTMSALKQLKELYDSGVLTEDEYIEKKEILLKKI